MQAEVYIFWKHPGQFRDFSLSRYQDAEDLKYLIDEFEKFARAELKSAFPENYKIFILIEDIDMAGGYQSGSFDPLIEFEGFDDTRFISNTSSAMLQLQYEIRDAKDKVLTNGTFRKRQQRLLPHNFYTGPKQRFPYISELFSRWVSEAKDEAEQAAQ
jgi:hypothetical protein